MQAGTTADEGALDELVRRYHGAMLRHAVILLRSRDLAEEVVQETWAAVVAGLANFEGRSTLKTWIFRILTNRAQTRLLRGKRFLSLSPPLPHSETGESRRLDARMRASAFRGPGVQAPGRGVSRGGGRRPPFPPPAAGGDWGGKPWKAAILGAKARGLLNGQFRKGLASLAVQQRRAQ